MEMEPNFIVSLIFSAGALAHLGWERGPARSNPPAEDLSRLQYVQAGDFLRIEGISELWVVSHRVWVVMSDQTELRLVLDGPIEDGG